VAANTSYQSRQRGWIWRKRPFPTVNSLVRQGSTNAYSAPLKPGRTVQAKIYASIVELWYDARWWRPMSGVQPAAAMC